MDAEHADTVTVKKLREWEWWCPTCRLARHCQSLPTGKVPQCGCGLPYEDQRIVITRSHISIYVRRLESFLSLFGPNGDLKDHNVVGALSIERHYATGDYAAWLPDIWAYKDDATSILQGAEEITLRGQWHDDGRRVWLTVTWDATEGWGYICPEDDDDASLEAEIRAEAIAERRKQAGLSAQQNEPSA